MSESKSPFGWFDAAMLLPAPLMIGYLIVRAIVESVAR